ncbi:MAG: argininosuccinate lyase [Thermoproteota archaeon]|nr:argininosuccinate lyase [Thermoproteota archaeon]
MYRSRPKGNLDKDMLNFLSSLNDDQQILHYDILGSEAHVIMLHDIGILTLHETKKILVALEQIRHKPAMLATGDVEDIHESIESLIIQQTGVDIGGKIQIGRSRNDQVMLDIRMKVRDDINEICEKIITLITSLLKNAAENIDTIMPMYTHLRQAQIGTFSHFALSYADSLFRDMDRLYITYVRINQSPLGAGAIGGSRIKLDRQKTARLLGFKGIVRNSIDATSSRDTIIEYTMELTIIMLTLSRMTEDFIIWSTDEFGYLDISDEFSSSSSAMPHKKNPDPLELLRAKAGTVSGNLLTMITIIKAIPSGYSRDMQEIKTSLWQASATTTQALKIMNYVVKSLIINKERMQHASSSSYAISFDLAELLAIKNGISFRTAHKVMGLLVQKAIGNNRQPLRMLREEDIREVLESLGSKLSAEEVLKDIKEAAPQKSISSRQSLGSPNPMQEQNMVKLSRRRLSDYSKRIAKRKGLVDEAFKNLTRMVNNYSKKA